MLARALSLVVLASVGVLLAAPTASAASSFAVSPCSGWTNLYVPTSVSITPDPPKLGGRSVALATTGNLKVGLTKGAKVVTTAKVGNQKVLDSTLDLCTLVGGDASTCPTAGTRAFSVVLSTASVNLPPFVTINYHSEAFNADGSKLFCFDAKVKFVP